MSRIKGAHAALAVVLFVIVSVSGCSSQQRPGEKGGHVIQPPTTEGPFCARHPFGEVKSGPVQRSMTQSSTESVAIASDDHPSDAGKLIVLDHPLEPLPLEV